MSRSATISEQDTGSDSEQKVSWLELFFDLIFVVAFDQLSKRLGDAHTPENFAVFTLLFTAIWWAWCSNALFAARYGNDSRAYRWGTLAELTSMGLLALTLRGDLKETATFFALSYGLNRLLHAGLHLWVVRTNTEAARFSRRFALATGFAALLWLGSALLPGGGAAQFGLWGVALLFDLLTPLWARPHGQQHLPHAEHLPERVGLLQIIVLGGAFNEIVGGGRKQELGWATLFPAFLAMLTLVCLWRLYFDQARALPLLSAHIQGRQGQMLAWLYGHLPFTYSIVVLGVGIGHGISSADAREVAVQGQFVVWSLAGAFVALAFLRLVSLRVAGLRVPSRSGWALAAGILGMVSLAFLDLDTKQLDLAVAAIAVPLAVVVATDPTTHRLGSAEQRAGQQLEQGG